MADDEKLAPGEFEKTLGEVMTSIVRRDDEELFALTEAEVAAQWYFTWEDKRSIAGNIYAFTEMVDLHKRRCRRWEEHHHGSSCVVERVRDKYLMPRIKAFMVDLSSRAGDLSAVDRTG